jgi:hypothetical protein
MLIPQQKEKEDLEEVSTELELADDDEKITYVLHSQTAREGCFLQLAT